MLLTTIQSEGSEFMIASSGADRVNSFRAELGESRLTSELEFSFLAVMSALATSGASFMARGAGDT